jgi:exonuclease III
MDLFRRKGKRLQDLKIGSWNVLSLHQARALKMLLDQINKYELDITAIQEMRWMWEGIIEKKELYCVLQMS